VIAPRARERGELGDPLHPELGGDCVAMQFDGALMNTERSRNLLVHPAVPHMPEHLPLAVGECGKTPLGLLPPGTPVAPTRASPL